MQYARARRRGVPHLACGPGLDDGKRKKETCNSCRDFVLRKRLSTFAAVNETSPPRPMDRTAAYEAADGSSSLPEGTMEPWQRWSMRGTENPENEVRVLGAPPEYMVSVAQMEERRVVAPVAKGSIPFRHTGQWGYSSAAEQRTVNPWAGGPNPSIPATERKHGREAEGTSLLTMRAADRPGGSNPPASARRSDGEAVNAPVCKTGIRRSESGSELRTLSWLNWQSSSFVMSRLSVRFRQTAQEYFVYLHRQTLNGYGNDIYT